MDLTDLGFADITPAPEKTILDEYYNEARKIGKMIRNKELTVEEYMEMRVSLVEKYIVMIPDLKFPMINMKAFMKFLEENESIRKRIEKINNKGKTSKKSVIQKEAETRTYLDSFLPQYPPALTKTTIFYLDHNGKLTKNEFELVRISRNNHEILHQLTLSSLLDDDALINKLKNVIEERQALLRDRLIHNLPRKDLILRLNEIAKEYNDYCQSCIKDYPETYLLLIVPLHRK
jgi:hypothetical protein